MTPPPSRDEIATRYFDSLPFPPYPVQEEAILAWFTSDKGVMVTAPTGTGKTAIAHAALYEALATGKVAYYTTPLIALTEQKFQEMRRAAERWGFDPNQIGLITGNRKVNPDAKVLIVVAEILLNRLLHAEGFDFDQTAAVVMDEFHSFADQERGIVWELSLNLLPAHVQLLLLSATVGNAHEFLNWLNRSHGRDLELVQGTERKVPLTYHWVEDRFLNDLLPEMVQGAEEARRTPALVFCFNRDECWNVAEEFKGLPLVPSENKKALNDAVDLLDWSIGVGPKLKQILRRGIGIHHAGLLPQYRRTVEQLFEKKLLSVCVCTETLASGINLPARSVVLTSLVKGPFGHEKLIDPSAAHQIFGRAGRPQFDTQGHVYAVAHEDDVRIFRWKKLFEQIPEDTKDPGLMKKRKDLKKKKPTRSDNRVYWDAVQFDRLQTAPPGKLYSKGPLPWRMLAYLLSVTPDVSRLRNFVRKRLLDTARIAAGERVLERMLRTLHRTGFVTLEPEPPPIDPLEIASTADDGYRADKATPTPKMQQLLAFRAIHPIYGAFLIERMGVASHDERLMALESVLELPRNLMKFVRVPRDMPVGPLQEIIDPELLAKGLIAAPIVEEEPEFDPDAEPEAPPRRDDRPKREEWIPPEERPPTFPERLRLLFDALYPDVSDVNTQSCWVAGELLGQFGGNFHLYVQNRQLQKQEGLIFRHLLRLVLLCEEVVDLTPPGMEPAEWKAWLQELSGMLTEACRAVDPASTEETVQKAKVHDPLAEGEAAIPETPPPPPREDGEESFGAGILDD